MKPRLFHRAFLSVVAVAVFVGGPTGWVHARQQQARLDGELAFATYKGDTTAIRSLLKHGASPDARLSWNPEYVLGPKGDLWMMEIIPFRLTFPWNMLPTRHRPLGEPALVYAAMKGHSNIFHMLLDAGAGVDLRDAANRTALIAAAWRGDLEMSRVLLAHGADARVRDDHSLTARDWAVREGHPVIVSLLDRAMAKE